ncbi:MAG: hypothetical protein IH951_11735 [Bacteroidetes bacterium]|nr:hypothetical protein [Bacteroidota bacterium]
MNWPYYDWDQSDGHLYDDRGNVDIFEAGKPISFLSADEADKYLIENDIRGTIR